MKHEKKLKFAPEKFEPGFLRKMDMRSAVAQRLTLMFHQVIEDLGGFKVLSHVKVALIERWLFQVAVLERMEARMAEDPTLTDDLLGIHTQGVNAMLGLAKTIGLDKSKAAVPAVKAYIAGKRA